MFSSDARIVYLQKVNKDGNTSKSIIINVVIDIPTHIPTESSMNFNIEISKIRLNSKGMKTCSASQQINTK